MLQKAAQEFKEGSLYFWGCAFRNSWVDVVHTQGNGVGDETLERLTRLTHNQLQQLEESASCQASYVKLNKKDAGIWEAT